MEKSGAKEVFRKKSLDKLASPEQLKDYVRVTTPSAWLVLAAILLALGGLMAWALGGYVTVTSSAMGYAKDGEVVAYFSDASAIRVGMDVRVGSGSGTVKSITAKPIARDDLYDKYEAYEMYNMNLSEFVTEVTIETDADVDGVISAAVVINKAHPISFVLN